MIDLNRITTRLLILSILQLAACGEPEMERRPPDAAMRDAPLPDAPAVTFCKGQPASCDSFDLSLSTDCAAQVGCIAERSCQRDFLFSCFSVTSQLECTRIGCSWASECESTGTGNLCFIETNPTSCGAKPGCQWVSFCDPLSHPSDAYCATFATDTACGTALGCSWAYLTCSGTPTTCEMLNEAACRTQRGCTWMPQ